MRISDYLLQSHAKHAAGGSDTTSHRGGLLAEQDGETDMDTAFKRFFWLLLVIAI